MKSLLLGCISLAVALPSFAAPAVGSLEHYASAKDSRCGLFLKNKNGNLTFYADTHLAGFLNVDGSVKELQHVRTDNHQVTPGRVQTGDTFNTTFAGQGTEAKLAMKVVQGCEAVGSVCASVREAGELTVSTATGKTTVAVQGGESCPDRE
jgi:hypothetical protein